MRSLSLVDKRVAVTALTEPTYSDSGEVETLNRKVEYLKTILRSLLIRSPKERKQDIKDTIKELDRLPTALQLQAFVDANYNSNYFAGEPDVEYKVALASALRSYMKLRVPTYNNPMFQEISERSLKVEKLLHSFIEG